MVTALLEAVEVGSPYWNGLVVSMKALGKEHVAVRDAVEAIIGAMPKPMLLYVTSIVKPTSASELTPIAKEQLRIAGKGYDQQDLDASARLAKNGEETSFHGFFEMRTVADAQGNPLYDVLLYMTDAGSIFDAGTTHEIGGLSQGGVVLTKKNAPLQVALQVAVGPKPLKPKAKKQPSPKRKTSPKT
jgi:hypothetical protein